LKRKYMYLYFHNDWKTIEESIIVIIDVKCHLFHV